MILNKISVKYFPWAVDFVVNLGKSRQVGSDRTSRIPRLGNARQVMLNYVPRSQSPGRAEGGLQIYFLECTRKTLTSLTQTSESSSVHSNLEAKVNFQSETCDDQRISGSGVPLFQLFLMMLPAESRRVSGGFLKGFRGVSGGFRVFPGVSCHFSPSTLLSKYEENHSFTFPLRGFLRLS